MSPRIASEKVAAGPRVAAGRLPTPDQSRYGPVRNDPPGVTLRDEGGGTTASCSCGWTRWEPDRLTTERYARDHKCKETDR